MNPSVALRLLASAVALLVWSTALPTFGQTGGATVSPPPGTIITYDAEDHTVTLNVTGVPLRQVLDAISAQSNIRFRLPASAPELDSRRITRSFERMALERAIKQLLGPSNTAMLYGTRKKTGNQEETMVLTEVRVLDMGIIPVAASTPETTANHAPAVSYKDLFTPEQIQANRAAVKEKKADKKQARQDKKGGGRSSGSKTTEPAQTGESPAPPAPDSTESTGGKSSKTKSSSEK